MGTLVILHYLEAHSLQHPRNTGVTRGVGTVHGGRTCPSSVVALAPSEVRVALLAAQHHPSSTPVGVAHSLGGAL